MVTQRQADATLKIYQDILFDTIPELVSLAVMRDNNGEWYIEAGITKHRDADISSLQVPDENGKLTILETLPIRFKVESEISIDATVAQQEERHFGKV